MIDINRLQKTSGIIGNTETIQEVLEMIVQVGPVDITVLVTGESGTGKEKVAKAIHKSSKRTHEPLIIVNCGAIPEGIPPVRTMTRPRASIATRQHAQHSHRGARTAPGVS